MKQRHFPFKKIDTLLSDVKDKVPLINNGGCAVIAALLANYLTPVVDDIKVVSCGWSSMNSGDIDEVRSNIRNNSVLEWNMQGIDFTHVWVEFKWKNRWYAVDACGIVSRSRMYKTWGKPYSGSFTIDEINELANQSHGWNPMFDRQNIPFIEVAMKANLSSYLQHLH